MSPKYLQLLLAWGPDLSGLVRPTALIGLGGGGVDQPHNYLSEALPHVTLQHLFGQ